MRRCSVWEPLRCRLWPRSALEDILAGCAEFASSGYRVRFKNENIVAWKDGEVSVLPPDLISVVDSRTAMAISNPEFEPGRAVTVPGASARSTV